jgi:hypothetical protein
LLLLLVLVVLCCVRCVFVFVVAGGGGGVVVYVVDDAVFSKFTTYTGHRRICPLTAMEVMTYHDESHLK